MINISLSLSNRFSRVYVGALHGLAETHKDKLNTDLLAFLKD